MAGFQPVPNVCEFRMLMQLDLSPHIDENILYIIASEPLSGAEITSGCEAAVGGFSTLFGDYCDTTFNLLSVHGRDLTTEFGAFGFADGPVPGTAAGAYLPPNNAALARFFPEDGGPPRQGGCYWPQVIASLVTEPGELTGILLDIADAFQSMAQLIAGNTGHGPSSKHVIVSRKSKTAWIAAHPGATPQEIKDAKPWDRVEGIPAEVGSYSVQKMISTQRRRRF